VIRDSNPDFQINLVSDPDICRNAGLLPKCCGFITMSASVILSWKSASDCMITANKSSKISYSTMVRECKSDPESLSGSGSPLKVNHLFRLVGPIIAPSFNESDDLFCSNPAHRQTDRMNEWQNKWDKLHCLHNIRLGGSNKDLNKANHRLCAVCKPCFGCFPFLAICLSIKIIAPDGFKERILPAPFLFQNCLKL